jgi:hypothetical protein
MKKILKSMVMLVAVLVVFAACENANDSDMMLKSGYWLQDSVNKPPVTLGTTYRGIVGVPNAGNFVSSDDTQICYDLLGETEGDFIGFKVDPPVALPSLNYPTGYLKTVISADGKYLGWEIAETAILHAFVIKGGSNYHTYTYPTELSSDWWLVSPSSEGGKGKLKSVTPQISHYNVCYEVKPPVDNQGCTPGYWRNHFNRWEGVLPTDDFDTTFEVDLFNPNITLGQAIWLGGGGVNALARHATAALLNAHGGVPNENGDFVTYPLEPGVVIQMVKDAVLNGTIDATKDEFDTLNNLGCPLSGTKAKS